MEVGIIREYQALISVIYGNFEESDANRELMPRPASEMSVSHGHPSVESGSSSILPLVFSCGEKCKKNECED